VKNSQETVSEIVAQPQASIAVQEYPDTVITRSGSKKIVVKVITDSINNETEKEIEVFIDEPDHYTYRYDFNKDFNKDLRKDCKDDHVIILKKTKDGNDSLSNIIVIKSGDSLRVITGDTTLVLTDGYDTTCSTRGGMYLYGLDIPEMSGLPEPGDFPEMPDLDYFYFDDGQIEHAEQYERALREYELQMKDIERQQRDLKDIQEEFEWQSREPRIYINPPDSPDNFIWVPEEPVPPVRNSEKIIRQELRDDGLTERGRKYVVEIDSRSMYINGEKQPKEIYKKYRKLVESTENVTFDADETFKMIF
jgi:hypothetical protein